MGPAIWEPAQPGPRDYVRYGSATEVHTLETVACPRAHYDATSTDDAMLVSNGLGIVQLWTVRHATESAVASSHRIFLTAVSGTADSKQAYCPCRRSL